MGKWARFAITLAVAGALLGLLSYFSGQVEAEGGVILDLRFQAYTLDELRTWLDGFSDEARRTYLTRITPLDIFFPLAVAYSVVQLWRLLVPQGFYSSLGVFLTSAFVLVDYLENAFIVLVLSGLVPVGNGVVFLLSGVTWLKWRGLLLVLVMLGIGAVYKSVRNRGSEKN